MGDRQVQLNTRILKRRGYWIAEQYDAFDFDNPVLLLLDADWNIEDRVFSDDEVSGFYADLEEYIYDHGPNHVTNYFNARELLEGLHWTIDHYPKRILGRPYQVTIHELDTDFGEADTLEEAICVAWLNYMERKDRREQKT